MKPLAHAVTSGAISIAVGLYFRSAACAGISFAAGTLIDIDHLVDYYAHHPFTMRVQDIYNAFADNRMKRLFVPLHSYELAIVLWLAIYAFSLSNIWKAMAIGVTQHILFDQFTNPLNRFAYFLTFRAAKRFENRLISRDMKEGV